MRKFLQNALVISCLSAIMLAITFPSTKDLWAQASTSIFGTTPLRRVVPVQVDNSGVVQMNGTTTYSGTQSVNISGVTPSSGAIPITYSGVTLNGGTLPTTGLAYATQLTLTRTSDTAAYTGGDVVGSATAAGGAVLTFTNMGPAAGHIIITDWDFLVEVNAVPSGMTSFRLHLYNATPPSNLGDNAAWDLPSGDWTSYLGYIDLGTPADVGSSLYVQTQGNYKKLKMGASTSLWAYLVTNSGYTPSASAVKLIRLNAVGVQ